MGNQYIAVDIGASSGRLMLSGISDGKMTLKEVHRFKNGFRKIDGHDRWNIDLLINILFRNTNISLDLLKELKGQGSVLFNFLLKEEDERKATRDFVVFRTDNNFRLRETLDDIIDEYFTNQQFSDLMLKSYLNILLAQLIRNYSVQIPEDGATKRLVVDMLSDITNEYATVSLKELSERYCYNRNYLSNIFKKEVGITFSEVLNRQRITEAHRLLVTTGLPVSDIMGEVGITNKSFFYRK